MSIDLSELKRYGTIIHCINMTFRCDKCEYTGARITYNHIKDILHITCTVCGAFESCPTAEQIRDSELKKVELDIERQAEQEVKVLLGEI